MSYKTRPKALVIYNPNAGKKRGVIPGQAVHTLEEIVGFFDSYQIPADFTPTTHAGHAQKLAKDAINKYSTVIAAGGDGTISEVASGLVKSKVILGILPLGSFMNIAKMLNIPTDLEKAIMLLKIGRIRKIDVGIINNVSGQRLYETKSQNDIHHLDTAYFLENAGVGMEALFQRHFLEFERGNLIGLIKLLAAFFQSYRQPITLVLDGQEMHLRSPLVEISNGPITGASLHFAPDAKLNDHRLTVSVFKMSKVEIFTYFLSILQPDVVRSPKIKHFRAKKVLVSTHKIRNVHADARIFGTTPVEFRILPNALNVLCGFPQNSNDSALVKRTILDS